MSWLRIDDKFTQHPKVLSLNDREFRVHLSALCYCAEYKTDGTIPESAWRLLGVTAKLADRMVAFGVWDYEDGFYSIHDFHKYNPVDPTAADRQRRFKQSRSGNGVGNGQITDESRNGNGEGNGPHASASAPVPVPSPSPKDREVANAPSLAAAVATPSKPRKPREPDLVWDAVADECGPVTTKTAQTLRGQIVRDLKAAGATPNEIHRRAKLLRQRWPDADLTDTSLRKHWDKADLPMPAGKQSAAERIVSDHLRRQAEREAGVVPLPSPFAVKPAVEQPTVLELESGDYRESA